MERAHRLQSRRASDVNLNVRRIIAVLMWCALTTLLAAPPARAYTVKKTETGSTVRWHVDRIPFRIDRSFEYMVEGADIQLATEIALDAWRGLPGVPDLLLKEGDPGPQGFNPDDRRENGSLYYLENWPFSPSQLAVTVTTYEEATGRLLDVDILVNGAHPFAVLAERFGEEPVDDGTGSGPPDPEHPDYHPAAASAEDMFGGERGTPSPYDLAGVLTHEVGHSLGLGESEDDIEATMWPRIGRGETHQRTLSGDDESGAETAYAGAPLSPTGGCGGATVARRTGPPPWLLGGAVLFGLLLIPFAWRKYNASGVHSRGTRTDRLQAGGAGMALVLVLVTTPQLLGQNTTEEKDPRVRVAHTLAAAQRGAERVQEVAHQAVKDPDANVRLAAAAILKAKGTYDHRGVAEAFAFDSDARVASVGKEALERVRRTAPAVVSDVNADVEAKARFAPFEQMGSALVGKAKLVVTEMTEGRIISHYDVVTKDGRRATVQIPGGTYEGITQMALHAVPPPDGAELFVPSDPDGRAWAIHDQGVLFGGWLGDEGPGIVGWEAAIQ